MAILNLTNILSILSLTLIGASAEPEAAFATPAIEERGDPCRRVRDVVDALKRQPDPYQFCDNYRPRSRTTTVFVTKTPTLTEYKYTTTTKTRPVCGRKRRRDVDEEAFLDIDKRDPDAYPPLPAELARYGPHKVQKACYCLPKPARQTITKTVTAPTVTVTQTKTKTACATCVAVNKRCEINNPGACCSQTCGVNEKVGPGYWCY